MVPRTCQFGVRYCSVSARATPLRCSTGLAISPDTSNRYRENRDDLSAPRHCPQLGRLLRPRPRGLPAGSAWPPKNDSLWAAPLHLTPGIQPAMGRPAAIVADVHPRPAVTMFTQLEVTRRSLYWRARAAVMKWKGYVTTNATVVDNLLTIVMLRSRI